MQQKGTLDKKVADYFNIKKKRNMLYSLMYWIMRKMFTSYIYLKAFTI